MNFADAMQAFKNHDVEKANRARNKFDAELSAANSRTKGIAQEHGFKEAKPQRRLSPDALLSSLVGTLSIMSVELRAWSEALSGKLDSATASFAEAGTAEKSLGYREPPVYIRPVNESAGDAFLEVKEWCRAQEAYRAALKQRPNSGFAVYGIALSAETGKDFRVARQMYAELLHLWRHADPDLAQMVRAKAFLAQPVPLGSDSL